MEDGEVEEVDSDAEDEIDREDEQKELLLKMQNLRWVLGTFSFILRGTVRQTWTKCMKKAYSQENVADAFYTKMI